MGDKEWKAEEVGAQRLFFNPWYIAGTCLSGRSDLSLEVEAAKWSRVGLRRWEDLVRNSVLIALEEFWKSYPYLKVKVFKALKPY